jgi:hypothetical protein
MNGESMQRTNGPFKVNDLVEDREGDKGIVVEASPAEGVRVKWDSTGGETAWLPEWMFTNLSQIVRELDGPPKIPADATVHVVEVFGRSDGTYVFADFDDAVAFEKAVNGDSDTSMGARCIRQEEVVCDHELTLKLIEGERE